MSIAVRTVFNALLLGLFHNCPPEKERKTRLFIHNIYVYILHARMLCRSLNVKQHFTLDARYPIVILVLCLFFKNRESTACNGPQTEILEGLSITNEIQSNQKGK